MEQDFVVLVDPLDNDIGVLEKMEAHTSGKLHRAVSVFIFDSEGRWLIHKRASEKYHSAGLWTNTCCSHPKPGESVLAAATRRLKEEMGMTCKLQHQFSFVYRAELDHNLIEHELDHVFIGHSDAIPMPSPAEVAEWKYITTEELEEALANKGDHFTEWFKLIYPRLSSLLVNHE